MAQDKSQQKELDILTESEVSCEDEKLPLNTPPSQMSPKVNEEVHCIDDLISQIVATFEKQNSSEENFKQSEKAQDLLKQLKKPSEVLTRINKINVVNYLDEAYNKNSESCVAVDSNLCETSQGSDLQCATNSKGRIKSDLEKEHKLTKSLNLQDTSQSLSALGQSKSSKLYEEKNEKEHINDFPENDSSNYKRPHLEEMMSKEYKTIQKIEKYVNNLVKEVLEVFEKETRCLKSPKKYKLLEPSEILKLINLSPITLKTPHVTDENQSATWAQKKPSVENLEQTNLSSASDLEQANLSSASDLEQTNLSSASDLEQANLSSASDLEQTNLSALCDLEQTNLSSAVYNLEQTNLSSACDLEQTNLSSVCDLEQTSVSLERENTSPDNLERTNVSPDLLGQDSTSKDLDGTTVPIVSSEKANTSAHHLEQTFMSTDSLEQTDTLINNSQPSNQTIGNEVAGNQTEVSEAKQAAGYIKNIVQILMYPKLDSKGILHDIQIITYFIDVIGFLNEQLRCGIITIFLEQRELNRTTSCVYENFVLLEFKRLSNVDINGIDVRVFGKGLLQDLKNLKIKISLLFREYNFFRLTFLQNSLKFSSIPFELLIGDVKNSWIVSLAKSAAEKICEEFKNNDELEDMRKEIIAERQTLLGYVEEFNEYIATLDQFSEDEREN